MWEASQGEEINKNRHNKEQRGKYGTADIIGPVKESGSKGSKRPLRKKQGRKKAAYKIPKRQSE